MMEEMIRIRKEDYEELVGALENCQRILSNIKNLDGIVSLGFYNEDEVYKDKELKDQMAKVSILKYAEMNNYVLTKENQQELYKKLRDVNYRELSLVKLFKLFKINYSYIKSDKEWKDIKIEL